MRDIAQYGANAGVSGFIYSSELHDVWERYSDEITDYLEVYADDCFDKSWESMIVDQLDSNDWTILKKKPSGHILNFVHKKKLLSDSQS